MLRLLPAALILQAILSPPAEGQGTALPSPSEEVRAVWLATAPGLDWPSSTDREAQQESLRTFVAALRRAHFNTIFFQVRSRGDAFYRSVYEPWAESLTGTLGADPGWDPLAFLLHEAHASGLELHAWFNVYKVRGPSNRIPSTLPPHPARAHPSWVVEAEGEGWLDPGLPEVRRYLLGVALDLVRNYDLDGIHFDYIRYPGRDFPDESTYRRYGRGQDRGAWRRGNINAFVREFYDSAAALRPRLKVGSAPMGVFSNGNGKGAWGAFHSYYQDARGWLRSGKHDYLVPQIYWDIGATNADPDFALLAREWGREAGGRHVYAGIGAYKPAVLAEIPRQIDIAREAGLLGQSFFRYEHIRNTAVLGGRYAAPAAIPPMPWKDSIPPLPPAVLAAEEISAGIFRLSWHAPPPGRDGEPPASYTLFRRSSRQGDIPILVACPEGEALSLTDTLPPSEALGWTWYLSARDRAGAGSAPALVSAIPGAAGDLIRTMERQPSLALLGSARVACRIPARASLSLEVLRLGGTSRVLMEGEYEAGTYVLPLDPAPRGSGEYAVRLRALDAVLVRPLPF
ncbi:MAG: family 10 glycosylhydrolase [Bacteroidota bacterium]